MHVGKLITTIISCMVIGGAGVVFLLVLSNLRPDPKPKEQRPWQPRVSVQLLQAGNHTLEVSGHGFAGPETELVILSEVTGRIHGDQTQWRSGDRISAGTPLLRINAPTTVAAARVAEAQVHEAEAELERLRVQHKTDTELLASDKQNKDLTERLWKDELTLVQQGVSNSRAADQREQAFIQARNQYLVRQQNIQTFTSREQAQLARVASLQAQLQQNQALLEKTNVTAPWDAIIVEALVQPGQAVTPATRCYRLAQLGSLEATLPVSFDYLVEQFGANILQTDFAQAEFSATFTLNIGAEESVYQGRIQRIDGRIDANTQKVNVIIALQKSASQPFIVENTFGRIRIQGPEKRGFRVPSYAINDQQVWVIDSNDQLQQRTVRSQPLDADHHLIDDGLQPGERLVLTPADRFHNGLQVLIDLSPAETTPVIEQP